VTKRATAAKVGIREVARVAGVSMASVSRVLNSETGNAAVRPDIVERVRRAADELRYRPNPWARSLRTAHNSTVGVIVSDLSHPFAIELLHVIYVGCRERGRHILVDVIEDEDLGRPALGGLPGTDAVDGIIVVGGGFLHGSDEAFEEAMARLVREYVHVVTVASHPSVAGESSIVVDDVAGVTAAAEHLIGLGHHRIAHIRDDVHLEIWENRQRSQAFHSALESHGVPHDGALEVVIDPRDLRATQDVLARLLDGNQPPTAVFVDSDMTAIAVLKAAQLAGIDVPGDLSVIGFDDIEFSALCTPSLTTVRQPIDTMGSLAVATLLDWPQENAPGDARRPSDKTVVVEPAFVTRDSCGPPRQGPS